MIIKQIDNIIRDVYQEQFGQPSKINANKGSPRWSTIDWLVFFFISSEGFAVAITSRVFSGLAHSTVFNKSANQNNLFKKQEKDKKVQQINRNKKKFIASYNGYKLRSN